MATLADYMGVVDPRKTIQPVSPGQDTSRVPGLSLLNRIGLTRVTGVNQDGTGNELVYQMVPSRANGVSDLQAQQNGVPQWIQNALGINAASMSPEELQALNQKYRVTNSVSNGLNTRTLTDTSGKVLGTNQQQYQPFDFVNDALIPGAAVFGAGYLGANALFGQPALGAGGLSGMDLAADAALGSGNNIITAGQALGAGGAAAAGAGASAIPTAANATNPALIESAAKTAGYGASSAGAGGAAAGSTLPSWLTSAGKQLGGRMLTSAVLGGLAGTAAAGSSSINTADRQGVANTLQKLGLEQADIARNTYTDAQGRINFNDGKFDQILAAALDQAQKQGQRSDQLWNTYASDFLPAAQKFAQTAMNYDTAGRRDEAAAAARAAVETESNMQRQAMQRDLARGGISLDAGRALALDQQSRFNQTKLSTGAAADARRKVEETGLNLLANTANIGQGIVGTSQQQAGQAITAGNAATGTLGAKESARNAALAPTQAFYGGATSATGSAGNVLNGVAATEAQNQANRNAGLAGLGQLAGTVLTAGKDSVIGQGLSAVGDWLGTLSDPKSKTVHGKVSGRKALADVEDAQVKKWTYKPGMGDGGTHEGRMAGKGDPMGPDGMRRIDPISEMGKLTAAVQTLAKDVKTIKRRLSLADAA